MGSREPNLRLERVAGTANAKNQYTCFDCTTSFVVVGLMFEYGVKSGQFFQPRVNHRDLDSTFLYEKRVGEYNEEKKPILNSMLNPQRDGDEFERGNLIALSFYEIDKTDGRAVTSTEDGAICTFWNCSFGDKSKATGVLSDVRAKHVTGEGFEKLLRLFNIKWINEDNEEVADAGRTEVTATDWASFFGMFKDCNFKTHQGLQDFVARYHLNGFQVQVDLTVTQNLRLMALWIRSWQNIRPMVGDGQHRSMSMTNFLHGFFEPKPIVPILPLNEFPLELPADLKKALIGEQMTVDLNSASAGNSKSSSAGGNQALSTPRVGRSKFIIAGLCLFLNQVKIIILFVLNNFRSGVGTEEVCLPK